MHEAEPVRLVERERHLADDPCPLLEGHALRGPVERRALDVLHGDVAGPLLDAHLVDLARVLVVDARLGPRLAQQPRRAVVLEEDLERDLPAEPPVLRPVDGAHPAAAEQRDGLVALAEGGGQVDGWGRPRRGGRRRCELRSELAARGHGAIGRCGERVRSALTRLYDWHTPPAQLCPDAHAFPHPPQLAGSVVVSTSQPFDATKSQSANPALHETSAHMNSGAGGGCVSGVHWDVAFGRAQTSLQ